MSKKKAEVRRQVAEGADLGVAPSTGAK